MVPVMSCEWRKCSQQNSGTLQRAVGLGRSFRRKQVFAEEAGANVAQSLSLGVAHVRFRSLLVTPRQTIHHRLPTMPPKSSNTHCLICEEELEENERIISCVGVPGLTHKTRRDFHFDCADTKGFSQAQIWLCADCKQKTGGYDISQSQESDVVSSPPQSQNLRTASNQQIDQIGSIQMVGLAGDSVFNTGDIVTFEVQLEQPSGAFPVPNSTLPFHQCEAEQPELMFFTEGNFSWAHPQDIFRDEDAAAQNPYYADLSRGYRNVLDSLAIEVEKHAAMQRLSYDRDDIKAEISDILTSVPLSVLLGICGAGLRARKARCEELYAWLVKNLSKSIKRPSIYVLEFTDQLGRAPSLEDMGVIVTDARSYLSDNPSAEDSKTTIRIDSAGGNLLSSGERAERRNAPDNDNRRFLSSASARQNMTDLLDSLDAELRRLGQTNPPHARMPYPLRDIGYTDHGPKRLRAQENLKSGSNPLMSLFNAIAQSNLTFIARERAAFDVGDMAVKYRLHGDVIFLGFRRDHAAIGEIVFSVLAQSYTKTGKGFNGVLAGVQNQANAKYDEDHFKEWQHDVWNPQESPAQSNQEAEKGRIAELRRKIAEFERLKLFKKHREAIVLANLAAAQSRVVEAAEALVRPRSIE
jgi:hypothetical protein